MQTPEQCQHSIFNQIWGEYKCAEKKLTLYPRLNYCEMCDKFKQRPKEKSEK